MSKTFRESQDIILKAITALGGEAEATQPKKMGDTYTVGIRMLRDGARYQIEDRDGKYIRFRCEGYQKEQCKQVFHYFYKSDSPQISLSQHGHSSTCKHYKPTLIDVHSDDDNYDTCPHC